jgi:hypothetical protein
VAGGVGEVTADAGREAAVNGPCHGQTSVERVEAGVPVGGVGARGRAAREQWWSQGRVQGRSQGRVQLQLSCG